MLLKWGMKLFIGGGVFMNEEITKTVVSMHHMIAHIDSKIEVIAKRFGVTLSQYFVLEALHNNGELAVNELQEEILDSNAAISLVIKNLEKYKLISSRLYEEDRCFYLFLFIIFFYYILILLTFIFTFVFLINF